MSITLDAASSSISSVNETSRSWSHTVGTSSGRRVLFVTFSTGGSLTSATSVTYGGTTMTSALSITDATYNLRAQIFYLINPPTGSNTVAVSWTTSAGGVFSAMSLYGVSHANPIFSTTTQTVTTGNSSLTVSVNPGCWALDAVAVENTDETLTVGAGQTALANSGTWHGAASREAWASGTSIAMTWSKSVGRRSIAAGIGINPASGQARVAVSPFLSY